MQRWVVVVAVLLSGCLGESGPLSGADAEVPRLACAAPCGALVDASPGGGWEPHVAVHPEDPDHIVVASRAQGAGDGPVPYVLWFDFHVSRDGGRTWNVTSLRETEPFGTAGPTTPNVVGDPVLAFLPDGTLLATGATLQYLAVPGGGLLTNVELYVVRSLDGGATFEEPVVVARSEGFVAHAETPAGSVGAAALMKLPDKPWLTTGPDGTALLTWAGYVGLHPDGAVPRSDILFSASRDCGRTWSDAGLVAPGGSLQGSSPVIASDGTWHVAYVDWTARMAHVATSRDGGATWSDVAVGPEAWMPALAVDRDRLFLATAAPGADGEVDAVVQTPTLRWSDDGAAWSDPLVLGEPEAPGRVLPSVAAHAGTAYVTHARPQGDGRTTFHATALGPGGDLHRLVLDPAIAGPSSRMGDYLGLAAGPGGAFAVWTTSSDGEEFDVAVARLTHGPPSANA